MNISGGTMNSQSVFGGTAGAESIGDAVASATGNIVNISEGTINSDVFGGSASAGSTDGGDAVASATGNIVNISGGTISSQQVFGGSASAMSTDGGDVVVSATGNIVNISGGTISSQQVFGGSASAMSTDGGDAVASATGNIVNISGGTINSQQVFGGSAGAMSTDGGDVVASASGNTVNISGGTINSGHVIGGSASAVSTGGTAVESVTGNTVNISGEVTFEKESWLRGGLASGDAFTENKLNLSSKIRVGLVENFEFLNFTLPHDLPAGEALLTVSDGAVLGNQDRTDSKITVNTMGTAPLQEGDQATLIDAIGTSGISRDYVSPTGGGTHGATLGYEFGISISPDYRQLRATVQSVRARNESKILSEGFLAGSILLNQTGDMIAQRTKQARCGAFFDISFGDSRYNTGSHIDMKGFSLLTGLTRCVNTASGKMTYGAFFEYGNGNDTGLYVTGARGNSDVYHYGGGVLGRLNFRNSVYAEGSFRAGGIDNGFTSNLLDGQGSAASYDSSSAYIGTHLGLGRMLRLSSRNTLDLYSKYFWTHQSGDSVMLSTNDPVKFDSIDSHRMRLGGRSNYVVNRRLSTYLGAAWEHEFAGVAKATTYGYDIAAPSLRGSTGVGELGMSLKARRALPLALDFGVQGYVGKREGVAGSVQVRWAW